MDQCSDTGCTHSDNDNERNPSEKTNLSEEGSPGFYAQSSTLYNMSTENEYHESQSVAITEQNTAADYQYSQHDNQVRSIQEQDFYMERIPESSGQHVEQMTLITPTFYDPFPSTPPLEQHSASGVSHSEHDNNARASLQINFSVEETIPTFTEQSYLSSVGNTQDTYSLPQTELLSSEDDLGQEKRLGKVDPIYHGSNFNDNTSLQQPEISRRVECNFRKNDKEEIVMQQNDKIPFFETGMETCCGIEISQKGASNSATNLDGLQNAHSVRQHQGPNFDDTFQNESVTSISSHMPNREDNAQLTESNSATNLDSLQNAHSVRQHQGPNFDDTFQNESVTSISSHMFNREDNGHNTETSKDAISISIQEGIRNREFVLIESENKFYCRACNSTMKARCLRQHWRRKHAPKTIKCEKCDEMFSELVFLRAHEKMHSKKYACDECPFITLSENYLEWHQKKNHQK